MSPPFPLNRFSEDVENAVDGTNSVAVLFSSTSRSLRESTARLRVSAKLLSFKFVPPLEWVVERRDGEGELMFKRSCSV